MLKSLGIYMLVTKRKQFPLELTYRYLGFMP